MTVIAHHICFWVTVCWALSKLHCWGLGGPACLSTMNFKKEDTFLVDTLWHDLQMAWPLQRRSWRVDVGKGEGGLCHAPSGPLCKL